MARLPLLPGLLLLLAGCQAPPPVSTGERLITPTVPTVQATIDVHRHLSDAFDHSDWVFVQVGTLKIKDPEARLSFRNGKLQGGTGCNRLDGSYSRQDSALRFGEVAMTRMFCAGKAEQENRISLSLQKVRHAVIVRTNDFLLLLDERHEIVAELAPLVRAN